MASNFDTFDSQDIEDELPLPPTPCVSDDEEDDVDGGDQKIRRLPFSSIHDTYDMSLRKRSQRCYIPKHSVVAQIIHVRQFTGKQAIFHRFLQARRRREKACEGRREKVKFPLKPELLLTDDEEEERKLRFIEVSYLSFIGDLGLKYKEGTILKRPGGYGFGPVSCRFLPGRRWQKRVGIMKDNCFIYLDKLNGNIREVILLDKEFKCWNQRMYGGSHKLRLINSNRDLVLKFGNTTQVKEWDRAIKSAVKKQRKLGRDDPYDSFAPMRENNWAYWFVDGEKYFSTVADALELAREEIFITGWWLNHVLHMKRPATDGIRWRLDQILKRRAEAGVRIFILIYKEIPPIMDLGSLTTKRSICSLHPNIKVLRHPDHHKISGIFLWSHHEKLVVIDQSVAFIGGIDLCYGRWDDQQHRPPPLANGHTEVTITSDDDDNYDDIEAIHGFRERILSQMPEQRSPRPSRRWSRLRRLVSTPSPHRLATPTTSTDPSAADVPDDGVFHSSEHTHHHNVLQVCDDSWKCMR